MTGIDDMPPPPNLRDDVMRSLRARGLVQRPLGARIARGGALLAASFALVALGALLGPQLRQPGTDDRPTFLLLLYEDSAFRSAESHIAEYAAWASSLRARGALLIGEKLADAGTQLEPDGSAVQLYGSGPWPADAATGLFIVRASGLEDALAIARDCPHAKYGGRIVVRPIERT